MTKRQLFLLLLLSASWGISFLMIRVAGSSFPPVWVAVLRSALGAVLLAGVLRLKKRTLPSKRLGFWLILVALFNNAIPFTCFAWGERIVTSSTAAVLNATTPIWTLLLTLAIQKTKPTAMAVAGVALGFIGVLIVVSGQQLNGSASTKLSSVHGAAVIAVGAFGYAVATVLARGKLRDEDPIGLAVAQLGISAILLIPATAATRAPTTLQLAPVLAIGVLGLIGSGVAYLIFYSLLAQISATRVAAVAYLLPIWGLFWGRVAGEAIHAQSYIGAVVAIFGLVLLNGNVPFGTSCTSAPIKENS